MRDDRRVVTETELRFPPSRLLLGIGPELVAGVLVLGIALQDVRGPVRGDRRASAEFATTSKTERSKWHDVAGIGSEIPVVVSVLVFAGWAATRRDWRGVAVALIGPSAALFLTELVLKPLVDREAANGTYSYPSGHATIVAALATTALLLVYRYVGPRFALLWSPYAIAVAGAVAFAVVALRWHYVTDSVGGVALGVGVVLLVAVVTDGVGSAGGRRARAAARAG